MLKSTMSDNRILQPSAITIVPSVADIFLTLPKTSIIAPPSICSLFGGVYAISVCHSLGKSAIQKNPAIKGWITEDKKNGRPCLANSENFLKLKWLRVNINWLSLR